MGFKGYIGLGILLLDLFLVLAIIGFIGIKPFALFALYYMLSLFGWSIIFRLTGILDEKRWEKAYYKNLGKIKWFRLSWMLIIIIMGLLLVSVLGDYLWISATLTACIVVLYLNYISGEFLHNIMMIQTLMQGMMVKKYKWLRK